jgi:hypothetical protein
MRFDEITDGWRIYFYDVTLLESGHLSIGLAVFDCKEINSETIEIRFPDWEERGIVTIPELIVKGNVPAVKIQCKLPVCLLT